ncbi:MAG: hypothetical protein KatS3mg057_3181 [Herpetosiphonaceae bacterium]|nr:MAG: hypothetical protein KatS3mg057_3181 [Herpetosiphonaceae bacterium]
MNTSMNIYYFACDALWNVFSLFHYLNFSPRIGETIAKTWPRQFEQVAQWLSEELVESGIILGITLQDSPEIYKKIEKMGDMLIIRLNNELIDISRTIDKENNTQEEDLILYLLYCAFLRYAIIEYIDLVDHIKQDLSESSYISYKTHYDVLEYIISFLNSEARSIEANFRISSLQIEYFMATIEKHAYILAKKWINTVFINANKDFKEL